ncbi:MAG: carbamoyltransferase C-terminal domain-containing protein [Candidatus Altiarchaeota archaeon]
MKILGIWDGHDAGAAIVEDGKVLVAINEERLTKKKLHVGFPSQSIYACLSYLELAPAEIEVVAFNTTDLAKTLTRVFPFMKDNYYMFRRRKIEMPAFEGFRRNFKYRFTEFKEWPFCRSLSKRIIRKNLRRLGFQDKGYRLEVVDHHAAHAAACALTSGFKKSLILTLDGIGDGLSGTINIFCEGELERISEIEGRDSFGIFYEQVTTLLGMRELEDEGKVMALADFTYEMDESENKLLDWFTVEGLNVKCKYSTVEKFNRLKKILWNTPREKFASMAQNTLEVHLTKLFENAIEETGIGKVSWSGGIASNIKLNMKVRYLPQLKDWFVFPHMGDGGLAVGSALQASLMLEGAKPQRIKDLYFGNPYSEAEMEAAIRGYNVKFERRDDLPEYMGDLIGGGDFALWYQGGMEFGPRALGNRSILAPAGDMDAKDKLNIRVKKRSWFQPFCPSLLEEEAKNLFEKVDSFDHFMTMGYMSRNDARARIQAILNVDGSARPQMLGDENPKFRRLIEEVKKRTGDGIVLNTSFNLHGFPIVNTPDDALDMMVKSRTPVMGMGDFLIELK